MAFRTSPWLPGTSYPPGSVVRPTFADGSSASPPTNADFSTGSFSGWTTTGAGLSVTSTKPYTGAYSAQLAAGSGGASLTNANVVPVAVGQVINATAYANFNGNVSNCSAELVIRLYSDSGGTTLVGLISGGVAAPLIIGTSNWLGLKIIDGVIPAGVVSARIGINLVNNAGNTIYTDNFYWDYALAPTTIPKLFYAIQSGTGKSGQTEPDWSLPPPISDGTVLWTSQVPTAITWQCRPLLLSSGAEPTWPSLVGQYVHDGAFGSGVDWLSQTPQVTDANLPRTKPRVMGASKIFAGNSDIVSYSATLDCTDWSSEANAGFLATGLRAFGDNPVAALGLYRGNLAVFNAQGFQMWSIDEDPANMQILDAKPIGCRFQRSLTPINDDLFFLTDVGLRSMGISAASGELMAGDVGMPIDPIVADALAYINATPGAVDQLSTIYYPGAGQFWMAVPGWIPSVNVFADNPATLPASAGTYNKLAYDAGTHVLVYTQSRIGEVGAWSHYVFPCTIEAFAILDSHLYIKSGDYVLYVDPTVVSDVLTYNVTGSVAGASLLFPCTIQWPWLDMGVPGAQKKVLAFEFEADNTSGPISFAFGYDQSNVSRFTTAFECSPGDSVPGQPIPLALCCASLSPRIVLSSYYPWKFNRLIVYTADEATGK